MQKYFMVSASLEDLLLFFLIILVIFIFVIILRFGQLVGQKKHLWSESESITLGIRDNVSENELKIMNLWIY